MKYLSKIKEPDFFIPVMVIAIVAVFAWNTFVNPWLAPKIGKDLSA